MKDFLPKTLLVTTILALSAPIAVHAQPTQNQPAQALHMEGSDNRHEAASREPRFGAHRIRMPMADRPTADRLSAPGLGLATQLAAAQIYLNITDEQDAAWEGFCQALIRFFEPQDQLLPQPGGQAQGVDEPGKLMVERLAEDAVVRGDSARQLMASLTELRGTLLPDQLERLQRIERDLLPLPAHRFGQMSRSEHGTDHRAPEGRWPHGRPGPDLGAPGEGPDGPQSGKIGGRRDLPPPPSRN